MVLENTSTDEFNDNSAPPSDDDAYSNSNSSRSTPIRLYKAPWQRDSYIQSVVHDRIAAVTHLLKREPTNNELQYTGYWTSRMLLIQSIALPVGVTGGLLRAYNTRATYRMPFWTPRMEEWKPYDYYPHPKLPLLRGRYAQIAWHSARASMYMSGSYVLAVLFFSSYAVASCVAGAATDARGKEIREAARRQNVTVLPIAPHTQSPPQERRQKQITGRTEQRQSGFEDGNATDNPQDTFESNDGTLPQGIPSGPQTESDTAQSSPFGDEPYGSSRAQANRTAQSNRVNTTPTSRGSAWDRVRQQSSGGSGGESTPRDYDSYVPTKTEEDTQSARDRAQREFDEQIERERQGGDFNSGKGGFKRW